MKTQNLINEFLKQKRFAMIGVSRNAREFSRMLFAELTRRGYDVVPVNANATIIDERRCFARIQDVHPPVTSGLILTPKARMEEALHDCTQAGVTLVWLYGITGEKEIDPRVMKLCADHGIEIVPGYCPFMFLPNAAMFHRLHGWVWKTIGLSPK